MTNEHDHNCSRFIERFEDFCTGTNQSFLVSSIWRYIRRNETPCGTCCAWLEKAKSNLSGRIYLIQIQDYRKQVEPDAYKIAQVIDI
jgi:hypothetical protein